MKKIKLQTYITIIAELLHNHKAVDKYTECMCTDVHLEEKYQFGVLTVWFLSKTKDGRQDTSNFSAVPSHFPTSTSSKVIKFK